MFESDSSDDESNLSYKSVTDFTRKEKIPLKLWAEHFSKPEKDRNRSLTKIFDKEFNSLKILYSFLPKDQVFGLALTKFGIPDLCGKINKKLLKISTTHSCKANKYERRNKIYPSKPGVLSNKTLSKSFKTNRKNIMTHQYPRLAVKKSPYSAPNKLESIQWYPSIQNCNFHDGISKQKDVLQKNTQSVEPNFKRANKTASGIYDQNIIDGKTIHSNRPAVSNKLKGSLKCAESKDVFKKYVRFDDHGLCSFAPTQEFLESLSSESSNNEVTFDEEKRKSAVTLPDNVQTNYIQDETEKDCVAETNTNSLDNLFTNTTVCMSNKQESLTQGQLNLEQFMKNKKNTKPDFEIEPYECETIVIEDFTESNSGSKNEVESEKVRLLNTESNSIMDGVFNSANTRIMSQERNGHLLVLSKPFGSSMVNDVTKEMRSDDEAKKENLSKSTSKYKTPAITTLTSNKVKTSMSNDGIESSPSVGLIPISQTHANENKSKNNHCNILESKEIIIPGSPSSDELMPQDCLASKMLKQSDSIVASPYINNKKQLSCVTEILCNDTVVIPETPSTDESTLSHKLLTNHKSSHGLEIKPEICSRKETYPLQAPNQTHLQFSDNSDDDFYPLSPLPTKNENNANITVINGSLISSEEVGINNSEMAKYENSLKNIPPSTNTHVQNINENIELSPCNSLSSRDYISDSNDSVSEELLIDKNYKPLKLIEDYENEIAFKVSRIGETLSNSKIVGTSSETQTGTVGCKEKGRILFVNAPAKLKLDNCKDVTPVVNSQANTNQISESKVCKILFPSQARSSVFEWGEVRNTKCGLLLTTDSLSKTEKEKLLTSDSLHIPTSLVSKGTQNEETGSLKSTKITESGIPENISFESMSEDKPLEVSHSVSKPSQEYLPNDSADLHKLIGKPIELNIAQDEYGNSKFIHYKQVKHSDSVSVCSTVEKDNKINLPSCVDPTQSLPIKSGSRSLPNDIILAENFIESNYDINCKTQSEDNECISCTQKYNSPYFSSIQNKLKSSHFSPYKEVHILTSNSITETPTKNKNSSENNHEIRCMFDSKSEDLNVVISSVQAEEEYSFSVCSSIGSEWSINPQSPNAVPQVLLSKSSLMSPQNNISTTESLVENVNEVKDSIQSSGSNTSSMFNCQRADCKDSITIQNDINTNLHSDYKDSQTLSSKSSLVTLSNEFSVTDNVDQGGKITDKIQSGNYSFISVTCTPNTSLPSPDKTARRLLNLSKEKVGTASIVEDNINKCENKVQEPSYNSTLNYSNVNIESIYENLESENNVGSKVEYHQLRGDVVLNPLFDITQLDHLQENDRQGNNNQSGIDDQNEISEQQTDSPWGTRSSPKIGRELSNNSVSSKVENEDGNSKKGDIYLITKTPIKITVSNEIINSSEGKSMEHSSQNSLNKSVSITKNRNPKTLTKSTKVNDYKLLANNCKDNISPDCVVNLQLSEKEDTMCRTIKTNNKLSRVVNSENIHKLKTKSLNITKSIKINNEKEQIKNNQTILENIDKGKHSNFIVMSPISAALVNTKPAHGSKQTETKANIANANLVTKNSIMTLTSSKIFPQIGSGDVVSSHIFDNITNNMLQRNEEIKSNQEKIKRLSSTSIKVNFQETNCPTKDNDFMADLSSQQRATENFECIENPNVNNKLVTPTDNEFESLLDYKLNSSGVKQLINENQGALVLPEKRSDSTINQLQTSMKQPVRNKKEGNIKSRQIENPQSNDALNGITKLYSSSLISLAKEDVSNNQSKTSIDHSVIIEKEHTTKISRLNKSLMSDTKRYSSSVLFLSKKEVSDKKYDLHINQIRPEEKNDLQLETFDRHFMFSTSSMPVSPTENDPCSKSIDQDESKLQKHKSSAYKTKSFITYNSCGAGANRSNSSTTNRSPLKYLLSVDGNNLKLTDGLRPLREKVNKKSSAKLLTTKKINVNSYLSNDYIQQSGIYNSNILKGRNEKSKRGASYKSFPTLKLLNRKDVNTVKEDEEQCHKFTFETDSKTKTRLIHNPQLRSEKNYQSKLPNTPHSIYAKQNVIRYSTSTIKPVVLEQGNRKGLKHKYKKLVIDSPPDTDDELLQQEGLQDLEKHMNEGNRSHTLMSSDEESLPSFTGSINCTSGKFSPLSSIGSDSFKSSKLQKRRLQDSLDFYTSDDTESIASPPKFTRKNLLTSPSSETNNISLGEEDVSSDDFSEPYLSDASEPFDDKASDYNMKSRFLTLNTSPQYDDNLRDLSSPDKIMTLDHQSSMMINSSIPSFSDGVTYDLVSSPAHPNLDDNDDRISPLYDQDWPSSESEGDDNFLTDMFDD